MADGCPQFFYDDAVCERLAYFDQPAEFLLLGLSGSGHERLIRNIQAAAEASVSVVSQIDELFLTPPAPAPASVASPTDEEGNGQWDNRPTTQIQQVTVNKARLSCFDLGGKDPLRRWARRQIVGGVINGNPYMATSLPSHECRQRGVLFVVDWEDCTSINQVQDELVAIMEKNLFVGIPMAVLIDNFDATLDDRLFMGFLAIIEQWEKCLSHADGFVEVFMGSIRDRRGYLEAFTWLLGSCRWARNGSDEVLHNISCYWVNVK